jgi:hypothetical protein
MITKGKWIVKENDDGSWVVMSGNIVIALFDRKDFPEWNESNANLIAAAPELLAACKDARIKVAQNMKSHCLCGKPNQERQIILTKIDKALALAEPK